MREGGFTVIMGRRFYTAMVGRCGADTVKFGTIVA
jgi:hypothetical protein